MATMQSGWMATRRTSAAQKALTAAVTAAAYGRGVAGSIATLTPRSSTG